VNSTPLTYQPLLDQTAITTVRAAYGLRKLRASYMGPAIRVKNTTNGAVTDVGFSAATGEVTTQSLTSLSTGGADLIVVTWYDQSGNGRHATSPSDYEAPIIVKDGVVQTFSGTTKPTIVFDGRDDILKVSSVNSSSPFTVSSNIEMFFTVRQAYTNPKRSSITKNGGIIGLTDITNPNDLPHFGDIKAGGWYESFCSTTRTQLTPRGTSGRGTTTIVTSQNYVGAVRQTGSKLVGTLNSDRYETNGNVINFEGSELVNLDTSISKFTIGSSLNGFFSGNHYCEILIVQSLSNSVPRNGILRSMGGYFDVSIGSKGGY
jgi:hypothetical protein